MYNALGFVEISGTTAAIDALDIMCKTAGVALVTWERKLGGRLVTLVITGEVSAVTDSIEAAKKNAIVPPVATLVIPNPHAETVKMVSLSAARLQRKNAPDDTARTAPDMRPSEPVKA
ncbi:MAG: BMC domain-containing protein [Clostridia bacterium]|jgi:ethanolamine utilization protein EutM|nr:BMC domain-containing protein [Clostridia bacterium]